MPRPSTETAGAGPRAGPRSGAAPLVASLLLAATWPAVEAAPVPPAAAALDVAVEHGLVTLDARQTPLADILGRIGERAGFAVTIHGELGRPVTLRFSRMPLEEGLRRLTRGESLALVYGPHRPGQPPPLVEMLVYPSTRSATSPRTRLGDGSRSSRLERLAALAGRRDTTTVAELAEFLARDPDPLLRGRAADALSRIGGPASVSALVRARADEAAAVRIRVLSALRRLEGSAALGPLRDALLGDPDPGVRRTAAWLLGSIRSEAARAALESALGDGDESVRRAAASALRSGRVRPR